MSIPFCRDHAVKAGDGYDTASLKGKTVVITGGARGLGEEMARQFVEAGAFVAIGDISEENGNRVVAKLGQNKTAFAQCDVTSRSDQVHLFKTALAHSPGKQIDIVVANAGVGGQDTVWTDDAVGDDAEPIEPNLKMLHVNIIGAVYTARLANHYLSRGEQDTDRCLVFTGSLAGYVDHLDASQYATSKWGVRGLMRTLRWTLLRCGIRVNLVAPTFVKTGILSADAVDFLESKDVPFAAVEDVGAAVMHIASDRRINGRALAPLPRSKAHPDTGYIDLHADDFNEGEMFTKWQLAAVGASG